VLVEHRKQAGRARASLQPQHDGRAAGPVRGGEEPEEQVGQQRLVHGQVTGATVHRRRRAVVQAHFARGPRLVDPAVAYHGRQVQRPVVFHVGSRRTAAAAKGGEKRDDELRGGGPPPNSEFATHDDGLLYYYTIHWCGAPGTKPAVIVVGIGLMYLCNIVLLLLSIITMISLPRGMIVIPLAGHCAGYVRFACHVDINDNNNRIQRNA